MVWQREWTLFYVPRVWNVVLLDILSDTLEFVVLRYSQMFSYSHSKLSSCEID